jgi:hypothetical protein
MKLSPETIAYADDRCREFYGMEDLLSAMRRNPVIWSWGARSFTQYRGRVLAFRVSGHHFKGNIALMVNGSDLMDIHLTNIRGKLVEKIEDIYIEDLIETIDNRIERVPEYR